MKKVLSVFLAVLMLFAALSVNSFAEGIAYHDWWGEGGPCNEKQAVLSFNLNGGSLKNETPVYNEETGKFEWKKGKDVTGVYYMVPNDPLIMQSEQGVVLPVVTPPDGKQFNGWECTVCPCDASYVGQTYAANSAFKLPKNAGGHLIQFTASYSTADFEEPTLTKVVNILMRVFGTIIGLIAYGGDTAQGIAFMQKVFGGLFD